jgi:Type II secretion system protein C
MPYRSLKVWWLITSAVLIVVAIVCGILMIQSPLVDASKNPTDNVADINLRDNSKANANRSKNGGDTVVQSDLNEDSLLSVSGRRLQRPVIDPPPPPAAAVTNTQPTPAAKPPQLNVELVGTAVDADTSLTRAWIKINGSQEKLIRVGDTLGETNPTAQVKLIEAKRIVLAANGFDLEYKFD